MQQHAKAAPRRGREIKGYGNLREARNMGQLFECSRALRAPATHSLNQDARLWAKDIRRRKHSVRPRQITGGP